MVPLLPFLRDLGAALRDRFAAAPLPASEMRRRPTCVLTSPPPARRRPPHGRGRRLDAENLNVWRVDTGGRVTGFFQRAFQREVRALPQPSHPAPAAPPAAPAQDWPSIKFTEDGSVFGHAVKNEVQFFSSDDPSAGVVARLRLPVRHERRARALPRAMLTLPGLLAQGVDKFSVSPGPAPHVAAFVPEAKVRAARVPAVREGKDTDSGRAD